MIQVQRTADPLPEPVVTGTGSAETGVSTGDVLVWVPTVICLAMMLFFLLSGSAGATGAGGSPAGSSCDTRQTPAAPC